MKTVIFIIFLVIANITYGQKKAVRKISSVETVEMKKSFSEFISCRKLYYSKKGNTKEKTQKFDTCVKKYLNEEEIGSENVREYSFWLLAFPSGPVSSIYKCSEKRIEQLELLDNFTTENICFSIGDQKGHVFFQDKKIVRISY